MKKPCDGTGCAIYHPSQACQEYNRQVDQLDMQIHLEHRSIRDAGLALQRRAATWEPRPCPPREEYP